MAEDNVTRKLAAILYADVAGYSRLTGADEEATHRALGTSLDAITATIEGRGGRVLHYAGDAILAEFASVVVAVACAVDVQRDLAARNHGLPDERKLLFRIGVNLGDVIVDRDELYGDGVNVAARLESLAEPGGICISRKVLHEVRDKLEVGFEFLGDQAVKNIERPIPVYRVLMDPEVAGKVVGEARPGPRPPRPKSFAAVAAVTATAVAAVVAASIAWWQPWQSPPPSAPAPAESVPLPDKPSIAVLPFANLSEDPKQEYFSDGITNDIITDLSKFGSLYVIASNTVFTYKGKPVKVQDVSREIGVRYVLEGSVQRADERVRINVQLIDATAGHHLWAERYDRDLKDLFTLQDEIVQTIVSALAVKVNAAERERAIRKDTDSLEAYDYLLRGWEYLDRVTRPANVEARQLFHSAIELDPRYASAYVGLGRTYRRAVGHGWTEFPDQALQQAHDFAQKALSLEESAAAHRLLGSVYLLWAEYDLAGREMERAIELNPNDWNSRTIQGSVMLYMGRPDEAIRAFETALRFNPRMDADRVYELGLAYYVKGRHEDAITTLEQNLGRNPDHVFSHVPLAAAFAKVGRSEDAAREAASVRRLHPFFEVASFGTRFLRPEDRASIADGLRKAGLK